MSPTSLAIEKLTCDQQNSNSSQNFIFDGQIKHATKVTQKELNSNFILLMSKKHICIMHYAL